MNKLNNQDLNEVQGVIPGLDLLTNEVVDNKLSNSELSSSELSSDESPNDKLPSDEPLISESPSDESQKKTKKTKKVATDDKPKSKKTKKSKEETPILPTKEFLEQWEAKKASSSFKKKAVKEVGIKEEENVVSIEDSDTLNAEFRPNNLGEVIGQDSVIEVLLNTILYNKIQNSLILQGPKGTGKTSTARAYAKTLNCDNLAKNIEPLVMKVKEDKGVKFSLDKLKEIIKPCGHCDSCREFDVSPSYVGVIEIDAGSEGKVDEVRNLKTKLGYTSMNKYQVVIIDEAHNMSEGGKTALLKIIEEPPKNVIFIFATTHPDDILPTIKSRSISLKFNGVDDSVIEKHLRKIIKLKDIKISDEAISALSSTTNGGVRDAVKNLEHASLKCANKDEIDVVDLSEIIEIEPPYIKEIIELMQELDINALLTKLNDTLTSRKLSIDAYHIDYFLKRIREKIYSNVSDENRAMWLEVLKVFLTEQERFAFNVTPRNVIDSAVLSGFEVIKKFKNSKVKNSKADTSNEYEVEKLKREYEEKLENLKNHYESKLNNNLKLDELSNKLERLISLTSDESVEPTKINKKVSKVRSDKLSTDEKVDLIKAMVKMIVKSKYKRVKCFDDCKVEYIAETDAIKFYVKNEDMVSIAKDLLSTSDMQSIKNIVEFKGFLVGKL